MPPMVGGSMLRVYIGLGKVLAPPLPPTACTCACITRPPTAWLACVPVPAVHALWVHPARSRQPVWAPMPHLVAWRQHDGMGSLVRLSLRRPVLFLGAIT